MKINCQNHHLHNHHHTNTHSLSARQIKPTLLFYYISHYYLQNKHLFSVCSYYMPLITRNVKCLSICIIFFIAAVYSYFSACRAYFIALTTAISWTALLHSNRLANFTPCLFYELDALTLYSNFCLHTILHSAESYFLYQNVSCVFLWVNRN